MNDQKTCDIFIFLKGGEKYEHKNVKHGNYRCIPLTQDSIATAKDIEEHIDKNHTSPK